MRVRNLIWVFLLIATTRPAVADDTVIGPILGAVSDTRIRIWIRAGDASEFAVAWKPSAGGKELTSSWALRAANDFTGTIEVEGLTPATSYDYRALIDGVEISDGRFRTLPRPGTPGVIRFAFAADINHNFKPYQGFDDLLASSPDFLILGGDQIYADKAPAIPDTKEAYEGRYRETWSDPTLQAALRAVPTFMTWDDHELHNDWWPGLDSRYANARVSFDEYQGSHNPEPWTPGEIYYAFKAGQIDFFVLDTRSHRSPNGMPDGPTKTMLGLTQRAALFSWLDASTARFKVIVSSVAFHDWSTTGDDSWNGLGNKAGAFLTERTVIFNHIRDRRIPGVVLVTGDQHWVGAFRLTAASPIALYEFAMTPIETDLRAKPSASDPRILYLSDEYRGFGSFTVDTVATPATLRFAAVDVMGATRYEMTVTESDTGWPAVSPLDGRVTPKIDLRFAKPAKDKLSLKIKDWDLPGGTVASGATVEVDLGGSRVSAILDERGRFRSPDGRDRVQLKQKKKSGLWTLTVKRKKGDFAGDLAASGLDDEDVGKPGRPVWVEVKVTVGGVLFRQQVPMTYQATAGKKGRARP